MHDSGASRGANVCLELAVIAIDRILRECYGAPAGLAELWLGPRRSTKPGRVAMGTRPGSEVVSQDGRRFLTATVIAIAAAVAVGTVPAASALAQSAGEVRGPSTYVATQTDSASKLIVAARNATSADQIEHHIAKIDGTRFHYATAGTGDPVLLIPGWPESWIAWRKVLPLLVSAGRRVVVLAPRGFGGRDKPAGG